MKNANFSSLFILCIALALLSVAQTSGSAQNQKGAGVVPACDVEAYVDPTGSNGVNVRSGPGKTYKVIGNLPNQKAEGIEVHITGASGDWMRIDKATEEAGDPVDRTFFHGEGWVNARLLGVGGMAITNGGTNLYQQMNKESRVVIRIPGGDDYVKVHGCRGKWMYVEYKKKKGWAAPNTLCANSLTTCV